MTVFEMLDAILKRYAGADPESLASFKPVYYARFGKREGPHLQSAFDECCATFKPTARQPFPIPADIEQHMPSIARAAEGGPKLDLEAHTERKKQLIDEWRQAQGHRGANGVIEVLRALEFIAEPIAHMAAWKADSEPLRLTRAQLTLAQHRALSLERRARHGSPPKSADEWWTQISAIAEQWGIKTTRDQWESGKGEKAKEAA